MNSRLRVPLENEIFFFFVPIPPAKLQTPTSTKQQSHRSKINFISKEYENAALGTLLHAALGNVAPEGSARLKEHSASPREGPSHQ